MPGGATGEGSSPRQARWGALLGMGAKKSFLDPRLGKDRGPDPEEVESHGHRQDLTQAASCGRGEARHQGDPDCMMGGAQGLWTGRCRQQTLVTASSTKSEPATQHPASVSPGKILTQEDTTGQSPRRWGLSYHGTRWLGPGQCPPGSPMAMPCTVGSSTSCRALSQGHHHASWSGVSAHPGTFWELCKG